jgi:hypothetical protein
MSICTTVLETVAVLLFTGSSMPRESESTYMTGALDRDLKLSLIVMAT